MLAASAPTAASKSSHEPNATVAVPQVGGRFSLRCRLKKEYVGGP